jgi:hypothetical protein
MLRDFHTHFPMGTAYDLRNLWFQARPAKDLLDQEERPECVTFQELGSCTSLHGQAFVHLKSHPELYYPNKIRT